MFSRGLSSSPLVGREDELDSLLGATSRPPALVLVEGEAGVGKTRLVQELLFASENGWIPQTKTAKIQQGKTTTVNFNLRPTGC